MSFRPKPLVAEFARIRAHQQHGREFAAENFVVRRRRSLDRRWPCRRGRLWPCAGCRARAARPLPVSTNRASPCFEGRLPKNFRSPVARVTKDPILGRDYAKRERPGLFVPDAFWRGIGLALSVN